MRLFKFIIFCFLLYFIKRSYDLFRYVQFKKPTDEKPLKPSIEAEFKIVEPTDLK